MKTYELCIKLASGEWKEAIDQDGQRYRLDETKGLQYRKNQYWLKCKMLPTDEAVFKKAEPQNEYKLTCWQAFEAVMQGGLNAQREDGMPCVKSSLGFLSPDGLEVYPITDMDVNSKWRVF